jgi:hypothetical protein
MLSFSEKKKRAKKGHGIDNLTQIVIGIAAATLKAV